MPAENCLTRSETLNYGETVADVNPCSGLTLPLARNSGNSDLFKFGHGGARPGAGRPAKPIAPTNRLLPAQLRWHVFQSQYKALPTALREIEAAGYAAYSPTRLVMTRRRINGIQQPPEPVQQPIFFSFAFVQFASDADWSDVGKARGVRRVLTDTTGRPWTMPDAEIARIREYEATQQVIPKLKLTPFAMGQTVKVLRGLCAGQVRMVLTCNGRTTTLDQGIVPGAPLTLARGDLEDVRPDPPANETKIG